MPHLLTPSLQQPFYFPHHTPTHTHPSCSMLTALPWVSLYSFSLHSTISSRSQKFTQLSPVSIKFGLIAAPADSFRTRSCLEIYLYPHNAKHNNASNIWLTNPYSSVKVKRVNGFLKMIFFSCDSRSKNKKRSIWPIRVKEPSWSMVKCKHRI